MLRTLALGRRAVQASFPAPGTFSRALPQRSFATVPWRRIAELPKNPFAGLNERLQRLSFDEFMKGEACLFLLLLMRAGIEKRLKELGKNLGAEKPTGGPGSPGTPGGLGNSRNIVPFIAAGLTIGECFLFRCASSTC
jgi:hypothetical protein